MAGSDLVLVPVGSTEQHGPHLPLETDSIIAESVAGEVASRIGARLGTTIKVGVSVEHMDFPGTETLTVEEFKQRIKEAGEKYGNAVFINGHGGNNKSLRELGVRHVNLTTLFRPYDHAGEIETSLIMYLRPELVKREEIRKHDFKWPERDGWRMVDYSKSGVLGDPTAASVGKGEEYFNELVEKTVELI
jgi:creatinine amidohydrolase/Fe(II)-dependent formamide hydrolase-like protein